MNSCTTGGFSRRAQLHEVSLSLLHIIFVFSFLLSSVHFHFLLLLASYFFLLILDFLLNFLLFPPLLQLLFALRLSSSFTTCIPPLAFFSSYVIRSVQLWVRGRKDDGQFRGFAVMVPTCPINIQGELDCALRSCTHLRHRATAIIMHLVCFVSLLIRV
jgi:hypothetical protein